MSHAFTENLAHQNWFSQICSFWNDPPHSKLWGIKMETSQQAAGYLPAQE